MNTKTLQERYLEKTTEREDAPVLEFLSNLSSGGNYKYLEVGAGTGRFPLMVKEKYKNLDIKCLEISKKLSDKLSEKGLEVVTGSVLDVPFENESFDIVHCSHLIEHFGYPDITKVLDELFRVVKVGGHVIIRTPLMHPNFYNDIDHIRPYPLKSLLQYFNNEQQQTTPGFETKLVSFLNRHQAFNFRSGGFINILLAWFWINFNFPKYKANGYVAIFQKQ